MVCNVPKQNVVMAVLVIKIEQESHDLKLGMVLMLTSALLKVLFHILCSFCLKRVFTTISCM